jgi:hypothetical protein
MTEANSEKEPQSRQRQIASALPWIALVVGPSVWAAHFFITNPGFTRAFIDVTKWMLKMQINMMVNLMSSSTFADLALITVVPFLIVRSLVWWKYRSTA